MVKYCKILIVLSIFFVKVQAGYAQVPEKNKFQKDLKIKGKDTKDSLQTPNKEPQKLPKDSTKSEKPGWFDLPAKTPSIVSEDTALEQHGGEPEMVIQTDEVLIDSVWITYATYYKHWDTYNIDPYNKKPAEFQDSLVLHLYDKEHLWSFPLGRCQVTSPFAYRWGRWHYGTDLALNTGDSVKAAFDGVVRIVRWDPYGYGYFVLIRHINGIETLYGHLSKQLVQAKQMVKAGDLIGLGGSTGHSSGPHLHYETRYQGDAFNTGYIYDYLKGGIIKSDTFMLTKDKYSYAYRLPVYNRYGGGTPIYSRSAVYHIIKSGDVLGSIAARYRTTVYNLCLLNGITANTTLRIGRRLRVR
jgi:murein DD-endopeptidase MepM/ murein hydrolase activator NlpD